MKPSFALNLSPDGIGLLHRTGRGWLTVGNVALDTRDLSGAMGYLRLTALALEPRGLTCKLILPEDQILYTTVEAPGPDAAQRRKQIRAALEGLTPYPVSDLVFDWSGTGSQIQVAVVARETLQEAEHFAAEHRFNPVSFVSVPVPGSFGGEPYFGMTAVAQSLLNGEKVERDQDPVRIVGGAAPQSGDTAPDAAAGADAVGATEAPATEAAETKHPAPPKDASATGAAEPAATAETADVPEKASGQPDEASSEPQTGAAAEPALAEPSKDEPAKTEAVRPEPQKPEPAKPEPAKPEPAAVEAAKSEAAKPEPAAASKADAKPVERAASHPLHLSPTLSAPETPRRPAARISVIAPIIAEGVAEGDAAIAGEGTADGAGASVGFSSRRAPAPSSAAEAPSPAGTSKAATSAAPKLTAPARDQALPPKRAAAPSAPARATGSAKPMPAALRSAIDARARKAKPPVKSPASRGSSAPLPVPPGPEIEAPANEAEAMTIFGARNGGVRGKPPYFGLILTAILVAVLAAVAIWSTLTLSQNDKDPIAQGKTAALTEAPAAQPAPAPDADSSSKAPLTLAPPTTPPSQIAAPEAVASAETTTGPAADKAPAAGTVEVPAPTAAPTPPVATVAHLAAAPEGVNWLQPATIGGTAPIIRKDEILLASIDPRIVTKRAAVLPNAFAESRDAPPPAPAPAALPAPTPVAPAIAEVPLVTPTKKGTLNPDGVMVYLGHPKVRPPERPADLGAGMPDPAPAPDQPAASALPSAADQTTAPEPPAAAVAAEAPAAATPPVPQTPAAATDAPPVAVTEVPLVTPTKKGTLNPDGVMVFLGHPKLTPPERPAGLGEGVATPEATAQASAAPVATPPAAPALVTPSKAGTPNADGILVFAGHPKVTPPERPAGLGATATASAAATPTAQTPAPYADPALAGFRPKAPPAELRTASAAAAAAAPSPATPATSALAVEASLKPMKRPNIKFSNAINDAVTAALAQPAPAVDPHASSNTSNDSVSEGDGEPDAEAAMPDLPTKASVARQATVKNVLDMRSVSLIGVFGSESDRKALVRMPNGSIVRVKVGDTLDGGRVAAISEAQVYYVKNGRNVVLDMPKG